MDRQRLPESAAHSRDSAVHRQLPPPAGFRFRRHARNPYSRRMKGLGLISLVVYAFGAFSYGTILLLWAAQAQQPGWAARQTSSARSSRELAAVNGVLLVVSFLWFCSNL